MITPMKGVGSISIRSDGSITVDRIEKSPNPSHLINSGDDSELKRTDESIYRYEKIDYMK
jgi:hypothetical protein